MTDDNAVREANVALATIMMQRFSRNMDGWYDNLHDDIVMELPFGPSIGMPSRVEGKEACSALFRSVVDGIGVQFDNIRITPMLDPSLLLVEYTGYSEPGGKIYDQIYICVQQFRDGKMILFREHWNALVVRDTFGNLDSLG